jgi:HEPN domain-containing protein
MERFEEAHRWLLQALRDLRAAEESLRTESYEWSAFQSQQAAEKAVKALGYALGRISSGQSVTEPLMGLREILPEAESHMNDSRELIDIIYPQDIQTPSIRAIQPSTTT